VASKTKGANNANGAAAGTLPAGVVWKGNPRLAPFLVAVADLHEDPANAMTHPERSVAAIAGSYARFGQQKPIVCAADLTVRDGNGQLRAAAERLGWTHVAAVPSDLEGAELSAYSLAVNRTAQHGEWDFEALAGLLKGLADEGAPIDDLGWADYELEPLLLAEWRPPEPGDLPGSGTPHSVAMADPIHVTADQRSVIDAAVARLRETERDESIGEGRCVELICADYLSRAGLPGGGPDEDDGE